MNCEEHFQKEEVEEFEIDGYKYKYSPLPAGLENQWTNQYMKYENGQVIPDFAKLNQLKFSRLVGAPYDGWETMSIEQRWELVGKLKPTVFSKIIEEINRIDKGETKKK